MRESARVAVKASIVFHTTRVHMISAAIQLSENPNQKLLMDITDTPLASKIERLIRGPKFSIAHPGSPSTAPSPYKRQKINLNSSPADKPYGGRGRGSNAGRGNTSRGGRGYRGRGGGRQGRNPNPMTPSPGRLTSLWGSPTASPVATPEANVGIGLPGNTPNEGNGQGHDTDNTSSFMSPIKRRVLLWDDEV